MTYEHGPLRRLRMVAGRRKAREHAVERRHVIQWKKDKPLTEGRKQAIQNSPLWTKHGIHGKPRVIPIEIAFTIASTRNKKVTLPALKCMEKPLDAD